MVDCAWFYASLVALRATVAPCASGFVLPSDVDDAGGEVSTSKSKAVSSDTFLDSIDPHDTVSLSGIRH